MLSRTSIQQMTQEVFRSTKVQDCVREYHESLGRHIDATSEYENDGDDTDFIIDDVPLPVCCEYTEGKYFV